MVAIQTYARSIVQNFRNRMRIFPDWLRGPFFVLLLLVFGLSLEPFPKLLLEQMLIVGLFAMSLNLIMGYGGMVHFGHAAFYGLGAYTFAILTSRLEQPSLLAMFAAPFVSAGVAAVLGWFCVRRVRLYFSILTLAFGQLIYLIIFQAREFTGGDDGIQGLLRPDFLTDPNAYYVFTVLVFAASFLALRTIIRSPFVLTLRAIRENMERAQFIGVDTRRHQLVAFVIGSFFAGIAGMLHNRFVSAEMLLWTTSAEPILASLLGGMFTMSGPLFGAALLTYLNVTITRFTPYWPAVLGTLTVLIVLLAPTGIVGTLGRFLSSEPDQKEG